MRIRDITGQVFGRLVAMHRTDNDSSGDDFTIGRAVGGCIGAFRTMCTVALVSINKG